MINLTITVTATATANNAAETLVIIANPVNKPQNIANFTDGVLYHFTR